MKKLMLTTAIASALVTSAMAQTTITGELRFNLNFGKNVYIIINLKISRF